MSVLRFKGKERLKFTSLEKALKELPVIYVPRRRARRRPVKRVG